MLDSPFDVESLANPLRDYLFLTLVVMVALARNQQSLNRFSFVVVGDADPEYEAAEDRRGDEKF